MDSVKAIHSSLLFNLLFLNVDNIDVKNIIYTFLIGIIVGGVIVFWFLNKSTVIKEVTMTVTSSNPDAIITDAKVEVTKKRKTVTVEASFDTDKPGIFTNTIVIPRDDLQYDHDVSIGTGYFMKSQLLFIEAGYSYKWFMISGKVGYSLTLKEIDYGFSVGGKLSF